MSKNITVKGNSGRCRKTIVRAIGSVLKKLIIPMFVTITLFGGLWGCRRSALDKQSTPAMTPDASAIPRQVAPTLAPSTSEPIITPSLAPQVNVTSTPIAPSGQVIPSLEPEASATSIPEPEIISPPAEEGITLEEATQLIPLYPSQVMVETVDNFVVLKWLGTGEDIIQYEIYRRNSDADDWQQLDSVKTIGDNNESYEFSDTTTKSDTTYIYGVTAIDAYGNKSPMSESVAITSQ